MQSASTPIPAALIGPRRRRQGTGPFLARFLVESGARIAAVVGTSTDRVAEARAELQSAGIEAPGFTDVGEMLRAVRPHLVTIASPIATHESYVEAALEAGCHVLCEKPLLVGGRDPGQRARALAEAFVRRGLHLILTAQWPYTLPDFARLHPGALDRPPETFEMHLAPARSGPRMIDDALPHALSLLAALRPGEARLLDPRIRALDAIGRRAEVTFGYGVAGRVTAARVRLSAQAAPPRPAGYALDGRWVERRIRMPGYRLSLASGPRAIEIEDPLRRLVREAVTRISSGSAPRVDPTAWPGSAHLAVLAGCWPATPVRDSSDR